MPNRKKFTPRSRRHPCPHQVSQGPKVPVVEEPPPGRRIEWTDEQATGTLAKLLPLLVSLNSQLSEIRELVAPVVRNLKDHLENDLDDEFKPGDLTMYEEHMCTLAALSVKAEKLGKHEHTTKALLGQFAYLKNVAPEERSIAVAAVMFNEVLSTMFQ